MTQADTTTGPAGQASRSTWKSFLSLIVILAIGIGILIAVPLLAGAKTTTAPAVENARGAAPLSGVSVDTLEKAAAAKARAMSGVAVGNSYNVSEDGHGAAPLSGVTIDPSTFDRTPRGAHGQLP